MTEPTYVYVRPAPPTASDLVALIRAEVTDAYDAIAEAVAAWEQWTEARSFDQDAAAATRLDAAMLALREVAT